MNEVSLIAKIIVAIVIFTIFAVSSFLGWRILNLIKRVKQLQGDRNDLLEERAKQSNKLRLKGIEMDESNKGKFILSELEKKMILNALNMPGYKNSIEDPNTSYHIRKTYKLLKEKIKESFD